MFALPPSSMDRTLGSPMVRGNVSARALVPTAGSSRGRPPHAATRATTANGPPGPQPRPDGDRFHPLILQLVTVTSLFWRPGTRPADREVVAVADRRRATLAWTNS